MVSITISYSQDVITKKNGEDIKAKVVEVTISEIKYKLFENLDGPIFTTSKSEILMIRYANGSKSLFNDVVSPTSRDSKVSYEDNIYHNNLHENSHPHISSYQGEVSVGYAKGIGTFPLDRIYFETVHGIRINPNFFIGGGLGYNLFTESTAQGGSIIPVFINAKGYFANAETTPFGSFNIGYGFGSGEVSGYGGMYISPAIGLKIASFNISVAYQSQSISAEGVSVSFDALLIKMGVSF